MVSLGTVARVFQQQSFKNKETRISAVAVALSTEYIRLFVKEAILRANERRLEEANSEEMGNLPAQEAPTIARQFADAAELDKGESTDAEDSYQESRGSAISTQYAPHDTITDDILATRHLTEISGFLVMDF